MVALAIGLLLLFHFVDQSKVWLYPGHIQVIS
jgi:hypothetical protein